MKTLYLIVLFALMYGIAGCFTVRSNENFTYSKLNRDEYAAVLKDSNNYYLIDVRTAKEYKRGHLPGAVNFSYLNFHFGRDADSLNRNKLALVYCQTCHRSPLAARKLKKMGFRKVYDLAGGYQNWAVQNPARDL
ncbi:MAG: rhodanese-like domain-containing protein [Ferruginibacter sp.]|nr:rhodanese-like domain-containing protein [Ferruginibacter sp.]